MTVKTGIGNDVKEDYAGVASTAPRRLCIVAGLVVSRIVVALVARILRRVRKGRTDRQPFDTRCGLRLNENHTRTVLLLLAHCVEGSAVIICPVTGSM